MNASVYKTDKTCLRGGFAFIQAPAWSPGKVSFQMTVPLQVQAEVSLVLGGDPDTGAIFSILPSLYSCTVKVTAPQTISLTSVCSKLLHYFIT